MRKAKIVAVASLLLFGAAACDLEVPNTNSADRDRALSNPSDVQALISGSWWSWYNAQHNYGISMAPALSTMSFQHSAYPGNFGMVDFSTIPRVPLQNATSWGNYGQFSGHWTQYYRAIAAVNAGLGAVNAGAVDLGADTERARAYGRFVQGIAHGSIAILFEQGPVIDETVDLAQAQAFVPSDQLLDAALGYLDESIAIAKANDFAIPVDWFGNIVVGDTDAGVSSAMLAQMASSYKAMLRASWARTPADAQQVNWSAMLTDINNGITQDVTFQFDGGSGWFGSLYYSLLGGWSQLNYFVFGMADQSGKYQEWMSLPISERSPNLPSGRFLIMTPDQRFPQGATLEAQAADQRPNPTQRFQVPVDDDGSIITGDQWGRPDRGEWRWSYYRDRRPSEIADIGSTPYISFREQRLLAAEAHYRLGDKDAAAAIVNESRVAAGLNATDASGTNTSCVPKLPNGSCGDLLEMIKWERRMVASHQGQYLMNTMYFDSRRWGDLMEGTIITFPVPCRDAQLETGITCESTGGIGGAGAAAKGTYGY